jgi:hypothetical protein
MEVRPAARPASQLLWADINANVWIGSVGTVLWLALPQAYRLIRDAPVVARRERNHERVALGTGPEAASSRTGRVDLKTSDFGRIEDSVMIERGARLPTLSILGRFPVERR